MKKNQRKYIFLILLIMFCICNMQLVVNASSGFVTKKDGKDVILTKYTGNSSTVYVPSNVTIVNGAFCNNKHIKKIVLSSSVKSIYDGSFDNLKNLKTVVLSKKLKLIEKGAFKKCPKIKKIVIPKKCESIGDWAFTGCTNLKTIKVEKGSKHFKISQGALFSKDKKELICYPRKNKSRKSFTVPKSVKVIASNAFKNNCYIEKIVVKGDAYDGGYDDIKAFTGMKKLKTVIFKTKQERDNICFRKCKKLKTVKLKEGTQKIGKKQFQGCENLVNINFPKSLKVIEKKAFEGCKKLKYK